MAPSQTWTHQAHVDPVWHQTTCIYWRINDRTRGTVSALLVGRQGSVLESCEWLWWKIRKLWAPRKRQKHQTEHLHETAILRVHNQWKMIPSNDISHKDQLWLQFFCHTQKQKWIKELLSLIESLKHSSIILLSLKATKAKSAIEANWGMIRWHKVLWRLYSCWSCWSFLWNTPGFIQ